MKIIYSLIIILLFSSASSHANDDIILSSLEGPVSEISERILTEAYNRIGFNLYIKRLPAERALIFSNEGQTDGETNRIKGINKKYTNLIMISAPVNYFEAMVFAKDLIPTIDGWDSLRPYKIGIRRGSKYAEKGTKGLNVDEVATYKQAFKMLSIGRIDVCVASRLSGLLVLKELNLTGIKMIEPPLEKTYLFHYLHNKNKYLVPKINNVLVKFQEEGLIEEIRNQYIVEHFDSPDLNYHKAIEIR